MQDCGYVTTNENINDFWKDPFFLKVKHVTVTWRWACCCCLLLSFAETEPKVDFVVTSTTDNYTYTHVLFQAAFTLKVGR